MIVGLVATMEPFFVINAPLFDGWLPSVDIPMSICGVAELEHLINIDGSVSQLLATGLTDAKRVGWSVAGLLARQPFHRNAVLDAGFDTYPWGQATETA